MSTTQAPTRIARADQLKYTFQRSWWRYLAPHLGARFKWRLSSLPIWEVNPFHCVAHKETSKPLRRSPARRAEPRVTTTARSRSSREWSEDSEGTLFLLAVTSTDVHPPLFAGFTVGWRNFVIDGWDTGCSECVHIAHRALVVARSFGDLLLGVGRCRDSWRHKDEYCSKSFHNKWNLYWASFRSNGIKFQPTERFLRIRRLGAAASSAMSIASVITETDRPLILINAKPGEATSSMDRHSIPFQQILVTERWSGRTNKNPITYETIKICANVPSRQLQKLEHFSGTPKGSIEWIETLRSL